MATYAIPAKSLSSFEATDLDTIILREVVENSLVEFKKEPPGGRWNSNLKLNDEGRDGLLKEIIAFANAFGGTLFVGIDETADHPKRASALTPVPKAADLAERIERCLQSCLEPQLISLEIFPLILDVSTGDGVLIIRIAPSPVAPHWNRSKGKCYRRVGADSVEIGMLDIQSLTLERARVTDQFDAQLLDRREISFSALQAARAASARNVNGWRSELDFPAAYLIRCTAIPTMPLRIGDPISTRGDLKIPTKIVFVRFNDTPMTNRALSWCSIIFPHQYSPGLREWHYDGGIGIPSAAYLQLTRTSGLLESRFMDCKQIEEGNARAPVVMQIEFLFTLVFSMLYQVDIFRKRTGYEGLAYELELEILTEGVVQIAYLHGFDQPGSLRFQRKLVTFPRYLVQSSSTFEAVATTIQHDVYNAMGRQIGGPGIVGLSLDTDAMAAYL